MLVNLVKTLSPHVARTLNSHRGMSNQPARLVTCARVYHDPLDPTMVLSALSSAYCPTCSARLTQHSIFCLHVTTKTRA